MHPGSFYDEEYYKKHCGPIPCARTKPWLDLFEKISSQIVFRLAPKKVLDFGCSIGLLVEHLNKLGVDAWGIDISEYAIKQAEDAANGTYWWNKYAVQDICTFQCYSHFDLITCIEVLEHLDEDHCKMAIERMTQYTDTVLFSSTPDDKDEPTHFNVQPEKYWKLLFRERGFEIDKKFDATFVTAHALLFRRK